MTLPCSPSSFPRRTAIDCGRAPPPGGAFQGPLYRTDLILAGTHATHTAAAVVRTMYTEAGGSANYRRSPLQRALRDVHAATQHVGIGPHWFEEGGRLLLGLPPSRPIVLL
jgi:alkylation response protein AidB-like acyl-CoA dehydrogenase